MITLLDKLNLRPQERRWVVMAVAALAVVLHFWFVQPYFKEWGQTKKALEKAKNTLADYRTTVARTNEYVAKLRQLEGQQGTGMLAEEVAYGRILIDRIGAQARQSKVNYNHITIPQKSASSRANEFFEEQPVDLGLNPTGVEELVDFLVAIGNSDLMVRVKDLSLSPDAGGYKLTGNMKLVASFQKKGALGPARVKPAGTLSSTQP